MKNLVRLAATSACVGALSAPAVSWGAADEPIAQDQYITGTLTIDWNARLPQNMENDAAKPGVTNDYRMDATVGHTFYKGTIKCLPYVFSRHIGRIIQEGSCQYDLDLGVINPSNTLQRRVVGKLVGTLPVDKDGRADISIANLRVEVQSIGQAKGFTSKFTGVVIGKPARSKTTLVAGSASARSKASSSCCNSSALIAFSLSGRFSVMMLTLSSTS